MGQGKNYSLLIVCRLTLSVVEIIPHRVDFFTDIHSYFTRLFKERLCVTLTINYFSSIRM